jgi:hypothetical protein
VILKVLLVLLTIPEVLLVKIVINLFVTSDPIKRGETLLVLLNARTKCDASLIDLVSCVLQPINLPVRNLLVLGFPVLLLLLGESFSLTL